MKNIWVHLQQFVVDSLHPNTLAGQRLSANEFEKWKSFVSKEVEKLYQRSSRLNLAKRGTREGYVAGLLAHLTELSNIVNSYLVRQARVWQSHPAAAMIKQSYVFTCQTLEAFIDQLLKKYPTLGAEFPFTDFSIFTVKGALKDHLKQVEVHLKEQDIETNFKATVINGINDLIRKKNFSRAYNHYLTKLMQDILKRSFGSSQALRDYLVINDFNLPEFFLFLVEDWSKQLTDLDDLSEQREYLLNAKSHLFDISLNHGLKFPFNDDRLYNELNGFLSEKYAIVKERLKISRQVATEDGQRPQRKRVMINLSVAQLGLFIRLQIEKGILMKEHVGELFAFYAKHYYTPNTDHISPESLQKKSSDVEHATARKLKAHLIAMINWLNTNYNLSNFN